MSQAALYDGLGEQAKRCAPTPHREVTFLA